MIGTGYLGTTHAAAMAELGHEVAAFDVDAGKVARLARGEVPFYEPGLPALLTGNLARGRLRLCRSLREAVDFAEVHFVCVGTPQRAGEYAADLRFVEAAMSEIAALVRPGASVVGKSTVPVGTAARLAPMITAAGASLVWNPEFLREGLAVADTLRPDRIVIGVDRARGGLDAVEAVYAPIVREHGTPTIVTDFATAELVKVAANAFLATKISFINAMAEVCEATGADVTQLADAIGHDARIGHRFLRAGLGFGGGCLPKDIRAFMARAGELGVDEALTFLKNVDEINQRRRQRTVDLARELCDGSLAGRRVAILGLAFKPDSDDIRDSPALDVAMRIRREGALVRAYDPHAIANARIAYPGLDYAISEIDACDGADVVLLLTEWEQFRALDPSALKRVVARPFLVDGRNALPRRLWLEQGWEVRALGRPHPDQRVT